MNNKYALFLKGQDTPLELEIEKTENGFRPKGGVKVGNKTTYWNMAGAKEEKDVINWVKAVFSRDGYSVKEIKKI